MTEHQIIHGCKQGDKAAFRALVDQYSSKLMGVCTRYLKSYDQSQDALQETYIRIFKSINNYDVDGNFEGWIRKIAVNESLKIINKNIKNSEKEEILNDRQFIVMPSISETLDEKDILNEINKLPEHYRIIFNLYEIEGYTHKEIGQLLNITESTSRTKLMRAKMMVRDFFLTIEKTENLTVNPKFV